MSNMRIETGPSDNGRVEVILLVDDSPEFRQPVRPGSNRSLLNFMNKLKVDCPSLSDEQVGQVRDDVSRQLAELQPESTGRPSKADLLLELAEDFELIRDESSTAFAIVQHDDRREVWPVGSLGLRACLDYAFLQEHGKAAGENAMKAAMDTLTARAVYEGEAREVFCRVATFEGALWIDLGDDHWRAVKVTKKGWEIVDRPPVLLTRRAGMQALPEPVRGGRIDDLFDLINLPDEDDQKLVLAWLVNALTSSSSYPILVLTGEQGSGKTTATRILRQLVDPHSMDSRSPPRNEQDIVIAANHGHVLAFENLSSISDSLSDALCRVATGAAFGTRKLYTDEEEQQFRITKPVMLNGIDDLATRSDLADRALVFQLGSIDGDARRTDGDIRDTWETAWPRLFGALLDLQVEVLRADDVEPDHLERMAEFSVLGARLERMRSWPAGSFEAAYRKNRDHASLVALETSAIGPVLLRMVEDGPILQTVGQLIRTLQERSDFRQQQHPGWPRTPRGLGNQLRRLAPCFRRAGIAVDQLGRSGESGGYRYSIKKMELAEDVRDVQ